MAKLGKRWLAAAGLVALAGSGALAWRGRAVEEQRLNVAGLKAPVEVRRDRWGVPHIYAKNTHDLFFAQGFVVAQDRLFQMEDVAARGRRALGGGAGALCGGS
jgi:penicillin amidase